MSTSNHVNQSEKLDRRGIKIHAVRDVGSLHKIADQWNRLAEMSPERLPMSSYAWIVSYLEHAVASSQSWCVLLAHRGDTLVGVLPLLYGSGRTFGFRRVEAHTPFDDNIVSVDILTEVDEAPYVIPAMLEGINGIFPSNYSLTMRRLPQTSPCLTELECQRARASVVAELDGIGSYLPIAGVFDQTLNMLSSNFRKNLKKARKKLAALPDVNTEFITCNDANESHLDALLRIEASGWKGRAGTAILDSPSAVQFYKTLTHRLAQAGWLEWHFLKTREEIIAAQMATKIGRTLVLCKIAYDEKFSHVSPGNMLFEKTVQRCCELGDIAEIDCLTDMQWHRNWRMEKKPHYKVTIFPKRMIAWLTGSVPMRMKVRLRKMPVATKVHGMLKPNAGDDES